MKAHVGVDAGSGLIHSLVTTPSNIQDVTQAHHLIREDDEVVYGDAGCLGLWKRKEIKEDARKSRILFRLNRRRGAIYKRGLTVSSHWAGEFDRQKPRVL